MYRSENTFRLTAKTGTSSNDSTRIEDDHTYTHPGLTSVSRPPPRRTRRTQGDDSHLHPTHRVVHRADLQDRAQTHIQSYLRSNAAPMNPNYQSRFVNVVTGTFVGPFSKEAFVEVTANHLDQRAEFNMDIVNLPTHSEPESVFFSVSRPDIPTKNYICRLVTYTQCSPAAFVVMLVYLDRIARVNPRLLITPHNMHRLLVTALTLACKVLDDRCFSNVHYAKVGGIPTAREMNRLELQFLKYVDYRLHVDAACYEEKIYSLQTQPPPTSPISIAFEGSPAAVTASSHEADDIHSMVSTASGTSTSRDMRYRGRTDSSQYPTTTHSNVNMEKWHALRTGVPPPPPPGGKRVRKDRAPPSDGYNSQHMQVVHEMG